MNITSLSDKQLAGQRLMVGFEGTGLNPDLRYLIDTLKVGGIILFSRNIESPGQIRQLCLSSQNYARDCGQPPLFIAIDQEGGPVARLREPFTRFPGNPAMKCTRDAIRFARVTATELAGVGINMNMAPVLDLAPEGINSIMSDRAFGSDPQWVAEQGRTVIKHLQENSIMAVAKHFPGIGRTTLDSHLDMPALDIDAATMETTDLVPFIAAVKQRVAGIMLGHILYTTIDSLWPASLSPRFNRDLLRRGIGFDGVVMTDDLDMGAIKEHYKINIVIRQILAADIDIALICHTRPHMQIAFEQILQAMGTSQSVKAKGMESVRRILQLKMEYLVS